jgi:hypothetical protein
MSSPWKRRFKRGGVILSLILILGAIIFFVPQEYPVPGAASTIISRLAGKEMFDFMEWMADSCWRKRDRLAPQFRII